MKSDPENAIDTNFKNMLCRFCIRFGLPGPPLDAPAALKTRPKRFKSAPKCSWLAFPGTVLGPFGTHFTSILDPFEPHVGPILDVLGAISTR